jgi:hypothetical protein
MALSKGRAAITQLTAAGTSTTVTLASTVDNVAYLNHSNGTGTVTVGATIGIDVQLSGGSVWNRLTTLVMPLTAAAVTYTPVAIPHSAAAVRFVYTAPTGASSHTLDAEIGTVTY